MRVTSKGQVTIPKHLRRRTGMRPGSEVDFVERKDGLLVTKVPARQARRARGEDDFARYLDRVTGIVDLGMTTDEFMELMRGE